MRKNYLENLVDETGLKFSAFCGPGDKGEEKYTGLEALEECPS